VDRLREEQQVLSAIRTLNFAVKAGDGLGPVKSLMM